MGHFHSLPDTDQVGKTLQARVAPLGADSGAVLEAGEVQPEVELLAAVGSRVVENLPGDAQLRAPARRGALHGSVSGTAPLRFIGTATAKARRAGPQGVDRKPRLVVVLKERNGSKETSTQSSLDRSPR